MAFMPERDLSSIQSVIMDDKEILELLDLEGKSNDEIAKKIVKRSQWNDLGDNEKRICIFFIPDKKVKNESFRESVIEINVHVPILEDFNARRILERIYVLLHKKRIFKEYVYFDIHVGELPTSEGHFCCGSRFNFYRTI